MPPAPDKKVAAQAPRVPPVRKATPPKEEASKSPRTEVIGHRGPGAAAALRRATGEVVASSESQEPSSAAGGPEVHAMDADDQVAEEDAADHEEEYLRGLEERPFNNNDFAKLMRPVLTSNRRSASAEDDLNTMRNVSGNSALSQKLISNLSQHYLNLNCFQTILGLP